MGDVGVMGRIPMEEPQALDGGMCIYGEEIEAGRLLSGCMKSDPFDILSTVTGEFRDEAVIRYVVMTGKDDVRRVFEMAGQFTDILSFHPWMRVMKECDRKVCLGRWITKEWRRKKEGSLSLIE